MQQEQHSNLHKPGFEDGRFTQRESRFPIQLLAIDIDGTLLDPHMEITPRVREAIHAAQRKGVVVTLATARRYINTRPIADALGLEIPLVLCDGALIMQHPQGIVLQTQPIQAEIAQQAVELMVRHAIQPVVQHDIINEATGTAREEIWTGPSEFDTVWISAYLDTFPDTIHRFPYDQLCSGQPGPLRIVAFASEQLAYGLIPEVTELNCTWNAIRRGNYGCAELAVLHAQCSKASGIATLARQLDIPMERVMAIGDNMNDIDMLTQAGWGVAMGQAIESVIAIADAVTTTNAEDGVAVAIERYILE